MRANLFRLILVIIAVVLVTTGGGCQFIAGVAGPTSEVTTLTHTVSDTISAQVTDVSATFLKAWFELQSAPFHIIDVRTPSEYAEGHIKGAQNIDFRATDFEEKLKMLDINGTYVIYCRTGARSFAASEIFVNLGFTRVINVTGGITEWIENGYPVVK